MTSDNNQVELDQAETNSEEEQASEQVETEAEQAPAAESADAEADDDTADLAAELAKAQATVKEYWDQIMRLNAEIENNRKRAQRDIENAHKFAIKNFVESLLPVTDSMEMGMNATENEGATLESIREGMNLTLDMFISTLEKNGIQTVNPEGEKFNPEHHQAMTMQESDEVEANTVLNVMQKGYLLNERLIRPAMVVVSKAKSS
jgi:molecular chaperone GrpE